MELMHIHNRWILPIVGVGLVLFAVSVLWTGFGNPLNVKMAKSIIVQDLLWVVGSAIVLIGNFFSLSSIGNEMILIVAMIVAGFAAFQALGLRRMGEKLI